MTRPSKYCCPTCGHPMLPDDPLAILGPTERKIFDVVYQCGAAGIEKEDLRERVYDGTTGGVAESLMNVHFRNINRKVRLLNLAIRGIPIDGRRKSYRVMRLNQVPPRHAGERSNLSREDVVAIRQDPRSTKALVAQYGVNRRTITRIRLGQSWKHVQ